MKIKDLPNATKDKAIRAWIALAVGISALALAGCQILPMFYFDK